MSPDAALFQAFLVPQKRQRYVELLQTRSGRKKVCSTLDHLTGLDLRFCHRVEGAGHDPPAILRRLKALGAPDACRLISSNSELDGGEMGLAEALTKVVGGGHGTFVSCLPGELAYFEGETPGERYICARQGRNEFRKSTYPWT